MATWENDMHHNELCRHIAGTIPRIIGAETPIARPIRNNYPFSAMRLAATRASTERVTSAVPVTQEQTLIRITLRPCHSAPPIQHSPDR